MDLKICLLTDQDLDAHPFPEDDWPCDPRPYLPDAHWTLLTLEKQSCVAEVRRAANEGYDLFFNLCDGAWDEGRPGVEVVQTLEALGVPFTGADSAFFEPSREAMKRVCSAWGIDTPAYRFARDDEEIDAAARALSFPLFVKHPSSYASHSLTRDSRVETRFELFQQARRLIALFGSTLIEEFIDGSECTSLVVENGNDPDDPFTYPALQYRFPEGEAFKHYDLKWVDYDGLESFLVEDPELDERIRDVSARFFRGLRGAGYGRCDMRIDPSGRIYMLEINPNCGVYYPPSDPASADLILLDHPEGHAGFTRRLVTAALARHRRRSRSWKVSPRLEGDYGIFAVRPISRGETIFHSEGEPHHLVTRRHVEESWDERRLEWFARYAWPLDDEIWVTWSPDPEEWRPVNHSCDPNAWLEGLNVSARRSIAVGEEITLDYATFQDERMAPFVCTCGSTTCRGRIRGDDHLLPEMSRYEGHFSHHIRRRRAAEVRLQDPGVTAFEETRA
ncbi:MAG: SET domain-containing protein-lysine N-methyltransferase [Longimicrobiales bacterium]|nr:SET domain-containing protein-lysine N-methyltransferase [Longimicrobiales bacterium]